MELQHRIALLPTEAQMVSVHLAVTCLDEQLTFLNASGPIFTCRADDEGARRFAAVMLTEPSLGLATTTEVAKALGRHRSRVHDYRKRYRDGGAEVLEVKRRGPRGASKLKGEPLTRAQQCLDEGLSNRKVAQAVGLSEGTIRKALKANRLSRVKRTEAHSAPSPQRPASTPRERTEADASCAGGVATTREEERALASTGQLPEAPVRFEAAQSVAKAGVLVALPALLSQGLLEVGQNIYAKLNNGYYGLTTMLLTFGLMALVRVKSAEGLTHYAPGEFGLVLGLDRAPEMKTVRRKLCELASRGRALEFARAFANRWTEQAPDTLGYLYIDGHVRPYHGRTHELPKTHVQRRRLCMPATTDYWVNDTDAQPLMFVTAPANEGLLAMMDDELLPEIRKLAGEARRVTLIFDREGWSPKRFKHWHSTGFDVITYRKGKYRRVATSRLQGGDGRGVRTQGEVLARRATLAGGQGLSNARGSPPVRRRPSDLGGDDPKRSGARDGGAADVLALAAGELLPLHAPRVRARPPAHDRGGAGRSAAQRAQSRSEGETPRAEPSQGRAGAGRAGLRPTRPREPGARDSHTSGVQDHPC